MSSPLLYDYKLFQNEIKTGYITYRDIATTIMMQISYKDIFIPHLTSNDVEEIIMWCHQDNTNRRAHFRRARERDYHKGVYRQGYKFFWSPPAPITKE